MWAVRGQEILDVSSNRRKPLLRRDHAGRMPQINGYCPEYLTYNLRIRSPQPFCRKYHIQKTFTSPDTSTCRIPAERHL